jgi:hypothetical protein
VEQADVAAAIETLYQQGREPSVGAIRRVLGYGSHRDIVRLRRACVPHVVVVEEEEPDPGRASVEAPVAVDEAPVAVAGLDCAPGSPLALALARHATAQAAERALAERHTQLKRERQAVEAELQRCETAKLHQGVTGDQARRQRVSDLARQRTAVEEARASVVIHLRQANLAWGHARQAAQELLAQAQVALIALRQAQRQAQSATLAWLRGDAAEHAAQCQRLLAGVIGAQEAQALAADPRLTPAWLGVVL